MSLSTQKEEYIEREIRFAASDSSVHGDVSVEVQSNGSVSPETAIPTHYKDTLSAHGLDEYDTLEFDANGFPITEGAHPSE